jgi:hypothetical protein
MMRAPPFQVMTANRLSDGAVVYLDTRERWVEPLAEALVAKTEIAANGLLAAAAAAVRERLIVGPYLFAVEINANVVRPISQREHIRSLGPTVGTDIPEAREGA